MSMLQDNTRALAEATGELLQPTTKTCSALLTEVANRYPSSHAVLSLHQGTSSRLLESDAAPGPCVWSYAQILRRSQALAHQLNSQGIRTGCRVVVLLDNQVEYALLLWATMHLGAVFVPLDPRVCGQKADLRYMLEKVEPSVIVVADPQVAEAVDSVLESGTVGSEAVLRLMAAGNASDALSRVGWTSLDPDHLDDRTPQLDVASPHGPQDTAFIIFTSGSTGTPKACPHSSITMCGAAKGYVEVMRMAPGHSICHHMNGSHVYGILVCLSAWLTGGQVVFPSPRFDAEASVRSFREARDMHVPCAPSMADALIDTFCALPDSAAIRRIRTLNVGGGIVSDRLIQKVRMLAPDRLITGFGMSEGAVTLMNSIEDIDQYVMGDHTCVGPPIPGAAVRVCAPDTRELLRRGEVGELHQGGVGIIARYYAQDSDRFYEVDGVRFVMTGDQAYMDDEGRVYMVGRYKDLIRRHGENLDPVKIESFFANATGAAAQVVGIADEISGEYVVVVLQRSSKELGLPKADELRKQASIELGAASVPTRILDLAADLGLTDFPRTVNGKIRKDVLRQKVRDLIAHSSMLQPESLSSTLEDRLAAIWSRLSGIPQQDIVHSLSIFTFADSMMQMEFLSAVYHKLERHLSLRELQDHYSIRSLADLLREKQPVRISGASHRANGAKTETAATYAGARQPDPGLEELVEGRVTALHLTHTDVEDVLPMTDYMSLMAPQVRPKSWSYRHILLMRNMTSQDVERLLQRWIESHALMRSTLVSSGLGREHYLVFSPSETLWEQQVRTASAVDAVQDLLVLEDGEAATSSGLLSKATIVPLKGTTHSAVVLHWHHSIFDGILLRRWYTELAMMVAKAPSHMQLHFWPYRDFARAYEDYSLSAESWTAADFHAKRLAGISLTPQQFWPPQRAPLWLRGDDTDWIGSDGTLGDPAARPLLDGDRSRGTAGMTFSVRVPRILNLQRGHQIRASGIAKAACVLFNLRETANSEAVFVSVESGRLWPSEAADADAPGFRAVPALEIDGPTMTGVLNRIEPPTEAETVREFLERLQAEQREIDQHTHAPIGHILERLHNLSPTGAEDAEIARSLINRQVFNWQPSAPDLPSLEPGSDDASRPSMQFLDVTARTDLGIVWSPSLQAPDTLCLEASWDDAQLYAREVEAAMATFLCCAAWLAEPEHLDRLVVECKYDGYEIRGDGKPIDYRR